MTNVRLFQPEFAVEAGFSYAYAPDRNCFPH
jgi:hypothetical protein